MLTLFAFIAFIAFVAFIALRCMDGVGWKPRLSGHDYNTAHRRNFTLKSGGVQWRRQDLV